jgi:linoleoyl-CoA desaturase
MTPAAAELSRPQYLPHGEFYRALHRRVDAHFDRTGGRPAGAPGMVLKTLAILGWLAVSYGLAMLWASTPLEGALCCVSLGLAMAGVGFNVQHDGGHGAYSRRHWLNALTAFGLDALGGSSYVWSWKHNVFHHSHPNVTGFDADVEVQPFCRLTPLQPRHAAHRFQHVYIWALYLLLTLKWQFVDDFRELARGRIGGRTFPRPGGRRWVGIIGGKALFAAWAVVLPLATHPWPHVALCFLTVSATVSLVLSVTFQLAHSVGPAFPANGASGGRKEWAAHQVEASVDFAPKNRLWAWYLGGLNFQIEHHLFPQVCHLHLADLSKIVRPTCEEFGVRYTVHPTAWAALVAHVRWLRVLGAPNPT